MLLTLPINPTSRKACVAGLLLLWSICSLGAPAPHNEAMRQSSSPYLRQHADNPVAWLPYSNNSMQKAAENQRLIFLSIGYSTCHWCHVMNRESFQNDEVASVLNTAFTAIKMDREQYPDADQYYNNLLVAAGGTAGWPLSAILMPDGTPAWIGNYVTKDRLLTLLRAFAGHFERGSPSLESQLNIYRSLITADFSERSSTTRLSSKPLDLESLGEALLAQQDPIYGGVAGAQKFPNPNNVETLWFFYDETGDARFKAAALRQLDNMLDGTLYDPLYGGFFRYATQSDWTAPHFEKLLITQANMLKLYSKAFERTGVVYYQEVSSDLYYMLCTVFQESREGYFYSAVDSEYNEVNGGNYFLNKEQIEYIGRSNDYIGRQQYDDKFILQVKKFNANKLKENRELLIKNRAIDYARLRVDKKIISEWNFKVATALLNFAFLAAPSSAIAQEATAKALNVWLGITDTIVVMGKLSRQPFQDLHIPATASDWSALCETAKELKKFRVAEPMDDMSFVSQCAQDLNSTTPQTKGGLIETHAQP